MRSQDGKGTHPSALKGYHVVSSLWQARHFYADFTSLDHGPRANYCVGGDALSALAWFDVSFVERHIRSES
jgi:hypothetical protein